MNLSFNVENYRFHVLNIVFEEFQHAIPSHSHGEKSYEIHYIPYGHGAATLQGRRYELSENCLYVTGPHIEHEQFIDPEHPIAEYCVYLKADRYLGEGRLPSGAAKAFLLTPFWFGTDTEGIGAVMQRLFQELSAQRIGCQSIVRTLLQQLVVLMARSYETPGVLTAERPDPAPTRISSSTSVNLSDSKNFIMEESFLYDYKDLTLELLSRRLALSPRQTERLLREQFGMTFRQKKTVARMSAAAALLRTSDLSVAAIAERLGYASPEHFSGAFRRHWDQSPREYRSRYANHQKGGV